MAELPDLDTDSIDSIAYWNLKSDGGLSLDQFEADEVLSYGSIAQSSLYDNGVEGTINSGVGDNRTVHFRSKSDGWLVTWLEDIGKNYGVTVSDDNSVNEYGRIDLVNDWKGYQGSADINNNTLESEISSLKAQFDNIGAATYNVSDVGLYSFQFPNASGVTYMDSYFDGEQGGGDYAHSETTGFLYTDGTTVYAADVFVGAGPGDTTSYESRFSLDGSIRWDTANYSANLYIKYVEDTKSTGFLPDPNVELEMLGEFGRRQDDLYGNQRIIWKQGVLAFWE